MDKNAIKKYATWARNELIERVSQKVNQYEISAEADPNADSAHGELLTSTEKKQRTSLIAKVKNDDFDQVIEEVAYTWFNRFAALRFMEVNNYLPSRVRVFTNPAGEFKPEILTEAIHLELDGLDMEKVYAFKDANDNEALFKYLIITQCNALSSVLPGMFQKIEDYTELLFPDNLLREGSVIQQMIELIPEEDWKDQVQIIGWLYQYYNTEPKDKVFADLKKKKKITKDKIPAATQLFTPDWIVRYMVENSLGRLWVEGHPDNKEVFLPSKEEQDHYIQKHEDDGKWHYYLEEAKQEPEVQKQLDEIHREYSALKPEDILCMDPCMGSGHILCYLFDVLMQIYEAYGYTSRDAVSSIVRNNLYGLDIDDRAAQLAYFSVMMKACQYDKRFLTRGVQPHVYVIMESNGIDPHCVDYFTNGKQNLKSAIDTVLSDLHDAKEYGSILNTTQVDFSALYARFDEIRNENPSMHTYGALNQLLPLIQVAEAMAQEYHVVVTNPPYMSSKGMNAKMTNFVKSNFPDSCTDLFSVFIEQCKKMTLRRGFYSMITMHNWMYIDSFLKLRKKIINNTTLISLIHLGIKAFEFIGNDVVQTCSFCILNNPIKQYTSEFVRLTEIKNFEEKQEAYFDKQYLYKNNTTMFLAATTIPYAYWASNSFFMNFKIGKNLSDFGTLTGSKNITGNNDKYLRQFWEVDYHKINKEEWVPYAKGGFFRKYYGNITYVINWTEPARHFYKTNKTSNLLNPDYWYKAGITYSAVTSRGTGFRYFPKDCLFDYGGPVINVYQKYLYQLLGFYNSKVAEYYFRILNPSVNLQTKDLKSIPYIIPNSPYLIELVKSQVEIAKLDWADDECTFEFNKNPIIPKSYGNGSFILDCVSKYHDILINRRSFFEENENEINKIFLKAYNMDIPIELERRDISVKDPNTLVDVKTLISYAVGCMFGRYSLDVEGLAYAGGDWDASKYKTYIPDQDAILPITDDEYFTDDIVGRFVEFVKVVYGEDTLEENLKFIADALSGKGTPREVIRNYFLKDFFKDHCKIYQKRPIYWLFDSGKKNGFKCLIYMHRYRPDTIARIRTDYVHEQQARYRTAIEGIERQINGATTSERVRLNKRLTKLKDQAEETRLYEEKIHHLADLMIKIDLDDGVKHNYAIFQDVLAKIK